MKKTGKIIEIDGFSGAIVDKEGIKYIFSNNDLLENSLKINDIVCFEGELFQTVDVKIYIARFVRKK